jgi:hypothetical protein
MRNNFLSEIANQRAPGQELGSSEHMEPGSDVPVPVAQEHQEHQLSLQHAHRHRGRSAGGMVI